MLQRIAAAAARLLDRPTDGELDLPNKPERWKDLLLSADQLTVIVANVTGAPFVGRL